MAAIRSAVNLTFGLMSCTVAVHSAKLAKVANVTVCTGRGGESHEATRIFETKNCPKCGVVHSDVLDKARPTPEGLVLLEPDVLDEIKQDVAPLKDKMTVTPHPVAAVDLHTLPGEKAYHLIPNRGHQDAYGALVQLIEAHPELAFVTRWVPRTNVSVFRVTSDGTTLFAQERVAGDDSIKPAPEILAADASQVSMIVGMAEQVLALPDVIQPFDLAQYRDDSEDKIAAVVASSTAVPDARRGAGDAAPAGANAALANLQAMLDAAKPKAKKRAATKRGGQA